MITLTREEAQKVQDALIEARSSMQYGSIYDKAAELLRAKLSEPEPEPVAYINVEERKLEWAHPIKWETPTVVNLPFNIPLYIAPPQREWQGLTAKDLAEIPPSCYEGAIWADAKLKEKNG